MSFDNRYRTHERLMTQLAAAQGVDLDLDMQTGALLPETYQEAVLACTGCSDPDGCRTHLLRNQTGAPAFCRNRELVAKSPLIPE